jgi:hypothetical protein
MKATLLILLVAVIAFTYGKGDGPPVRHDNGLRIPDQMPALPQIPQQNQWGVNARTGGKERPDFLASSQRIHDRFAEPEKGILRSPKKKTLFAPKKQTKHVGFSQDTDFNKQMQPRRLESPGMTKKEKLYSKQPPNTYDREKAPCIEECMQRMVGKTKNPGVYCRNKCESELEQKYEGFYKRPTLRMDLG